LALWEDPIDNEFTKNKPVDILSVDTTVDADRAIFLVVTAKMAVLVATGSKVFFKNTRNTKSLSQKSIGMLNGNYQKPVLYFSIYKNFSFVIN